MQRLQSEESASSTLYMNHLYPRMTASDLREIFSVYGEVAEIDKSGGWARIRFEDPDDAKRALDRVNKKDLGKDNFKISDGELLENFVRKPPVQSASTSWPRSSTHTSSVQHPSRQIRTSHNRSSYSRARTSENRPWHHVSRHHASHPDPHLQYGDLIKVFRKRRTNFIHLKKKLLTNDTRPRFNMKVLAYNKIINSLEELIRLNRTEEGASEIRYTEDDRDNRSQRIRQLKYFLFFFSFLSTTSNQRREGVSTPFSSLLIFKTFKQKRWIYTLFFIHFLSYLSPSYSLLSFTFQTSKHIVNHEIQIFLTTTISLLWRTLSLLDFTHDTIFSPVMVELSANMNISRIFASNNVGAL